MKKAGLLSLVALLGACAVQPSTQQKADLGTEQLQQWMDFLTADDKLGRDSGTPQLDWCAGYLAAQFESFGLTTVPGMDSYFQAVPLETEEGTVMTYNVVAYLEGADPARRDEYVLVGAHYDHMGVGAAVDGDSIYNGADDDASGTVTMLGLAQLLAAGERPAKSVVFAAWTAEEQGLLGSQYFAAHPPLPLEKMVMNVNLEMTGHSETTGKGKVWLTGAQYSDFDEQAAPLLAQAGMQLVDNPFPTYNLFYRSDNASFVALEERDGVDVGIPAHTFCTWGGEEHYHQPNDEADALDYDNMLMLVKGLTAVVQHLTEQDSKVSWTSEKFTRYTGQ